MRPSPGAQKSSPRAPGAAAANAAGLSASPKKAGVSDFFHERIYNVNG
jgi:hypothetical protein